ncbi:MAG: hypothetical protein D6692_08540 [Planctomycetota bacterium]|nr:MAG: hypothetical protein D6692_08540 [Planctomycetota bacterium]
MVAPNKPGVPTRFLHRFRIDAEWCPTLREVIVLIFRRRVRVRIDVKTEFHPGWTCGAMKVTICRKGGRANG